jgi:glycosyltransferase involved in cell wall biosynthesis
LSSLSYYYFERLVWQRFGDDIRAGRFDLVHRITPLSPTTPSSLARRCRAAGVPFVLGPLNGGVAWPRGFDYARRYEREWFSYVRDAYKLLPGYRGTRACASAVLVGSQATLEQVPARYRDKCVYVPENAVDPQRFQKPRTRQTALPLRVVFVGRLVPYKGPDMLLEAAAPLIRQGRLTLDFIGDGPLRGDLAEAVARAGIEWGVRLSGWVDHADLQDRLREADILALPSIREFGGGVVLEAMALGVAPMVVNYGGPAELVTPSCGFLIDLGSRQRIIEDFREALDHVCRHPALVGRRGLAAIRRVERLFTWDRKAQQVLEVYRWVLGQRASKPDFGLPLAEPDAWDPSASALAGGIPFPRRRLWERAV